MSNTERAKERDLQRVRETYARHKASLKSQTQEFAASGALGAAAFCEMVAAGSGSEGEMLVHVGFMDDAYADFVGSVMAGSGVVAAWTAGDFSTDAPRGPASFEGTFDAVSGTVEISFTLASGDSGSLSGSGIGRGFARFSGNGTFTGQE